MTVGWRAPTTTEVAYRRASGRRAYNALRQDKARIRRIEMMRFIGDNGLLLTRGLQRHLAFRFGVSAATVSRDMKVIIKELHPCPHCGNFKFSIDED